MKYSRHIASFALLLGVAALLVADEDGPECTDRDFEVAPTYVTDCTDEPASGQVTLKSDFSSEDGNDFEQQFADAGLDVSSASVFEVCNEDGEAADAYVLQVQINGFDCSGINVEQGGSADCTKRDSDETCAFELTFTAEDS